MIPQQNGKIGEKATQRREPLVEDIEGIPQEEAARLLLDADMEAYGMTRNLWKDK